MVIRKLQALGLLGLLRLWLGCALLAAAARPAPVAAQQSAAERETARALMQEGDRLRAAGDLRGALTRYESAHAIMHVPTTGLDLARVQAQLGLVVEARSTATEVVHLPVTAGEPHVFGESRLAATALAAELESVVPAIRTVVEPGDAEYALSIDGHTLPAAAHGVAFRANPGSHAVRVEAVGYASENRQVTLIERQTQTLTIRLTPLPASERSSELRSSTIAVPPASAVSRPAITDPPEDVAASGRLRGIVGLSIGGAALVVGGVTGALSLTQTHHEKARCDRGICKSSQASALSSANTLANIANISIPIGVLGVAYGLYELLTLPSSRTERAHGHGLQLALDGTSASLRGEL